MCYCCSLTAQTFAPTGLRRRCWRGCQMKSLHSVSLRLSTVKSWAVGRKCCIYDNFVWLGNYCCHCCWWCVCYWLHSHTEVSQHVFCQCSETLRELTWKISIPGFSEFQAIPVSVKTYKMLPSITYMLSWTHLNPPQSLIPFSFRTVSGIRTQKLYGNWLFVLFFFITF